MLDADRKQHKIKLAAIDAPERKQRSGAKSKQSLSDMHYHQHVTVEWTERDRNGRILGNDLYVPTICPTLACADRTDANYRQIAAGMAWRFKQYEREQSPEDRERYAAAENQARAAKRGLWADPAPVAPWEWRRQNKLWTAPSVQ